LGLIATVRSHQTRSKEKLDNNLCLNQLASFGIVPEGLIWGELEWTVGKVLPSVS
jgi:hypothetical protein